MTWFKVDDSFHSHPKAMAASPAALGLWVVAGSWSGMNLTEGHVPAHVLPRLMPKAERLARELVAVGLWDRVETGFVFHDWTSYNPTRAEAIAARDRQSSGGAIGNHRRWHEGKGKVDPHCRYCQKNTPPNSRVADRVPDGGTESVPNPPSRPDPTRVDKDTPPATRVPPKGDRRGHPLPDDFTVTEEMAVWAREKAPSCGTADHEAFCDYWRGIPGAKGRKLDWVATWRNWMRREHERRARPTNARPGNRPAPDDRIAAIQALKHHPAPATPERPLNLIQGELA